jgi:hypothetical protein
MEVGGYYNFVLTKALPSRVIPKFLEALAERWPEMLIRILDYRRLKSIRVCAYSIANSKALPEEGSILVSKDESMEKAAQEMGFRPMGNGEASLLLLYSEGRSRNHDGYDPTLQQWQSVFNEIEERIGGDESDLAGVPRKPGGKLTGIYSYDLVTPKEPDEDDFSAWAVRALVEAYSGE